MIHVISVQCTNVLDSIQVYRINVQQYNCSKQRACTTSLNKGCSLFFWHFLIQTKMSGLGHGDEVQTIQKWKLGNKCVHKLLTTLMSGEEDQNYWRQISNQKKRIKCQGQTNCCQTKSYTDSTFYLIFVVLDCRQLLQFYQLHDDCSCQRSQTEWGKIENICVA